MSAVDHGRADVAGAAFLAGGDQFAAGDEVLRAKSPEPYFGGTGMVPSSRSMVRRTSGWVTSWPIHSAMNGTCSASTSAPTISARSASGRLSTSDAHSFATP